MLYEKVIEMGNVSFTNTVGLSKDEWLKLRTNGIGGSDAGAILNMNKYATPLSVYLAKKEFASFSGNGATEWGNILEDPVRQKTKEELQIEIETVPGMFTSLKNPFMNANFDGLVFIEGDKDISGSVVSGLGGHEIKTSRTGDGFTQDEIPDSYYCQVQHYMAVTGLTFFVLTVFIFDKYAGQHYVIKRNDVFIDNLINAERTFWEKNILTNEMPAPTGNDNEAELVKSLPMAEHIELPVECSHILESKDEIDRQIKELQTKSKALQEQILIKMNEASTLHDSQKTTAVCSGWQITYNEQSRRSADSSSLKKAGLFEQYSKESKYKVMRTKRIA